MVVATLQPG